MSFPTARRSWKCGDVWDKERREYVDSGKGCRQEIYQSLTEKFPSGKPKIKNLKDGRGGKAGEDHLCHNTGFHGYDPTWKAKYRKAQENLPCGLCGEKYNAFKMPVCPNCYKQECRVCHARQQWVFGEGIEMNTCRSCGSTEGLDIVETYYYRKKRDSNFKTAKEMMG